DAYRIMKTNGPRGRDESDVAVVKGLFMSPDSVAVDTAALKFFNQFLAENRKIPVEQVKYLEMGEAHGLGVMDASKLNVERIKV
ncbi:MAG: hypothetical protein ACI4QC_04315, partial [Thermoguttaceae bacterium]